MTTPTQSSTSGPWRGIFPPLITPLTGRDELDVAGLERLIEHVLGGGVHGLFLLGTTGEAPGLSPRLRRELVARAVRQVAGRVPILVGVTDTSFTESVSLACFAAEQGAQALVAAAPPYFPAAQPELWEYVQNLAAEMPLPLFLYNMPSHTKIAFEPDTIRRAMGIEAIVGLKDSGAGMIYFHHLVRLLPERPGWTLLMGPEELLAESVLLGGHGGVCGGANLFPRLYVDLYQAASRGDLARVRALHGRVIEIAATLYRVGGHGSAFLKALKCALSCRGICDDFLAEPFRRFGPDERGRVRQILEELDAPGGRR